MMVDACSCKKHAPEEQHGFCSKLSAWRAPADSQFVSWQSDSARNTRLVGKFRLFKSFWPCALDYSLELNVLRAQDISDHMIWMLSKLYEGQSGEVRGKWGSSRNFPITSSVRQGCVLSPRWFSAVLQVGYERLEARCSFERIWVGGWPTCAAGSAFCRRHPINCKIICWNRFAPTWFGHCTVASWFDTQCEQDGSPDKWSTTTTAFTVAFWGNDCYFGTQLWSKMVRLHTDGTRLQIASWWLQQASKAFFANRWIRQDHQVSIATRLKYFDKVVTTVACFAAGHRALYKNDLVNMDVSYRKL